MDYCLFFFFLCLLENCEKHTSSQRGDKAIKVPKMQLDDVFGFKDEKMGIENVPALKFVFMNKICGSYRISLHECITKHILEYMKEITKGSNTGSIHLRNGQFFTYQI